MYEKLASRYERAHNYEKALKFYKKALHLREIKLHNRIKSIKKILEHKKKLDKDTRKIVTRNSPAWTHSIGQLIIPLKLHFINKKRYTVKNKKCSATLVNLKENEDSNIIITASHCIQKYNKQAGPLKFVIQNNKKNMVYRIATIKYDSHFDINNMKSTTDFAILKLQRPILNKEVKPIVIQNNSFRSLQKSSLQSFGSLAGFSNDIAQYGKKLTYDPKCTIKEYNQMYGKSSCSGFSGASGGAIMLTTTNDNKKFQYHFIGVVSHFRNKNYKNIFFAPHHLFFNELQKIYFNL